MTRFLISDENPHGSKLEDLLREIRNDILHRATKIMGDDRDEATRVLNNNIKILGQLAECIELAEDSTHVLDRSFGRHRPNQPRIGTI